MLPIPAGSPPPYVPIAPLYPHLFVTPRPPPLAWQVPLPPLVPPLLLSCSKMGEGAGNLS